MMHGSEVTVTSDPRRKIDELASDLDDLTTTVEELEIEATNEADADELRRLQHALEKASDAADVVDDNDDLKMMRMRDLSRRRRCARPRTVIER